MVFTSLQRVVDLAYNRSCVFLGYVHHDKPMHFYKFSLHIWEPIWPIIHVINQILVYTVKYQSSRGMIFILLFYPLGCMLSYYFTAGMLDSKSKSRYGFMAIFYSGWYIHMVNLAHFIIIQFYRVFCTCSSLPP